MIFEHANYRSFLKEVLVIRAEKNPSYSLRAMAKQLELSPASLSQVIKGTKNFSPEMAQMVATKLNLDEKEAEYFRLLVQLETSKNNEIKDNVIQRLKNINPQREINSLNVDYFKIISDWHHFAILALAELDSFQSDPKWIADRLNISVPVVELAIERLLRIEMLEKDSKGNLKPTHMNPRVSSDGSDQGVKRYHKQTLERAIESLETQSIKEKFVGTETMAIDHRDLEKYRDLAEEFFNRFAALSAKSRKKDQVYHLGIQFFRVTKKGDSK